MLPMNNVAAVIMAITNCHCGCASAKESANNRMKATKAAPFTTVAINEVNTVGAPSYTSGVQKWNGAAETLKDNDTINNNKPTINNGVAGALPTPISSIKNDPVLLAPYKKAIPSSIIPVEKAPIKKYFKEASL